MSDWAKPTPKSSNAPNAAAKIAAVRRLESVTADITGLVFISVSISTSVVPYLSRCIMQPDWQVSWLTGHGVGQPSQVLKTSPQWQLDLP
jgi:hypothetical protein